jgi:hypothetical protein
MVIFERAFCGREKHPPYTIPTANIFWLGEKVPLGLSDNKLN